jgi:hypothetical protein
MKLTLLIMRLEVAMGAVLQQEELLKREVLVLVMPEVVAE